MAHKIGTKEKPKALVFVQFCFTYSVVNKNYNAFRITHTAKRFTGRIRKAGSYLTSRYLILNAGLAIEMSGNYSAEVKNIVNEGIDKVRYISNKISFNSSSVNLYYGNDFRNIVNEAKFGSKTGAITNPEQLAGVTEEFVRLSAFQDDKRIDRVKKCLRPGSFATTKKDYLACKNSNDDPVERYALPSEEKIKWAFLINPKKGDILQLGIVEPANDKMGGGEEAYFEHGTSEDTFVGESKY